MERATFYRADAGEYRSVPLPNGGSVFAIQRATPSHARRTRGWVIGTRVGGDFVPFCRPSSGCWAPLTRDTLREAKEDVRRMARTCDPKRAARTYCAMREHDDTLNARHLVAAFLAGSDEASAFASPNGATRSQEARTGAERCPTCGGLMPGDVTHTRC